MMRVDGRSTSSLRWSNVLPGALCPSKRAVNDNKKKTFAGKTGGSCSSSGGCSTSTRERHSMAARESQEAIAAAMTGVTPEDTVGLYNVALKLRLALFTEIFRPAGSLQQQQQQQQLQRAPRLSCSGLVILNTAVSKGLASSNEEAALLCNRLVIVGALCGASGPTIFSTSPSARYRFSVDRYSLLASDKEGNSLLDGTRCGGAMTGLSFCTLVEVARGMRHFSLGVARTMGSGDVPGFTGRDAVDWLINSGPDSFGGSREGAVATLSALVRVGAFADAAERGNFEDGATRFCFAQDVFMAAARASFRTHAGGVYKTIGHEMPPPMNSSDTLYNSQDPDASGRTLPGYNSDDSLLSSSWTRRS